MGGCTFALSDCGKKVKIIFILCADGKFNSCWWSSTSSRENVKLIPSEYNSDKSGEQRAILYILFQDIQRAPQ